MKALACVRDPGEDWFDVSDIWLNEIGLALAVPIEVFPVIVTDVKMEERVHFSLFFQYFKFKAWNRITNQVFYISKTWCWLKNHDSWRKNKCWVPFICLSAVSTHKVCIIFHETSSFLWRHFSSGNWNSYETRNKNIKKCTKFHKNRHFFCVSLKVCLLMFNIYQEDLITYLLQNKAENHQHSGRLGSWGNKLNQTSL